MGTFADLSAIINRATGGNSGSPEHIWAFKNARVGGAAAVATIAGRWTSLWQYEGSPAHGAAPGAVAIPDNTTNGGLKQTDPGGGRQKYLLGVAASASQPGVLVLYDRLLHLSGLSGTTTSAQTVGGTLTRYTNGQGNQIWAEIYTQIGGTATTITASYTDQDNNASQTTQAVAFGATNAREAQRMLPLSLAAGDSGVRAVASVTVLATTGTAGDFGIVVAHPLVAIPIATGGLGMARDLISGIPSLPEILTDACLAWVWIPNGTSAPEIIAEAHFAEV